MLHVSPRELLWQHTVFPYSTAFLRPELMERLEETILERPVRSPWGAVPLTQSVSQGLSHRRYCVVCAKQDNARLGESYWHRCHNLPGVYRCVVHGVPLHETQLEVRDRMHLPTDALPAQTVGHVKHFALGPDILADLARRSAELLTRRPPDEKSLMQMYRARLHELGLARGQLVASHDFAYQLLRLYGHPFLRICGAAFSTTERSPWPALVARSLHGASIAPVKHVLVQAYLASATRPSGARQWGRPGPKPRDLGELDRTLWTRLCLDLSDPRSDAGLAPIRAWLTQIGVWGAFRHNRPSLSRTADLVASVHHERMANRRRLAGLEKAA